MYEFILFLAAVFGVLQIILFFKIWIMTNQVKEMRDFFVYGRKQQTTQSQASQSPTESHDYDKRLDELDTGDVVRMKSTGKEVKIIKTWGNEFVVSTPTGNECLPKWKLEITE